jgi:16S rRNA processing protein RimM
MPSPGEDFLAIGKIRRTQGRHGEVAADILTDFPDRFSAGEQLLLSDGDAVEGRRLETSRFHKGRVILKFAGCDSMDAAEKLIGRWIVVPRGERRELPPGVVYLADLIGCTVREAGQELGVVEALEETTGAPVLLRVCTAEGELLVPFAAEICRIVDVRKGEIEVRLPEGLRELNRAKAAQEEPRSRLRRSRRNRESR